MKNNIVKSFCLLLLIVLGALQIDAQKYAVSFNYNSGGTIRDNFQNVKLTGTVDSLVAGSSVNYFISYNQGFILDSFFVNDSLVTKTNSSFYYYSITNIRKNYNLRFVFKQQGWSVVNISYNSGGTVYFDFGTGLSKSNNIIYNRQVFSGTADSVREGDTAGYLFIPDNNYIVDSLFVDGVYQTNIATDNSNNLRYLFLNVSGNHSIRMVFNVRAPYYRINRSNSPGGSIVLNNLALPPTGYDSFASGSTQRYSFVANQGYVVDSVFVNNTYIPDSVTGYTFRNISNNQNLRVVFDTNFVRLRISSNYGGCINLNYGEKFCGPISIDTNKVNGSYYFTINSFNNVHILDSNYYIDSVIINGISQNLLGYNQRGLDTGFGTFTFFTANITANYDLRVVYKQYPKYVLTINYNYGDNNQFRYYKNYFNNINLPSSGFYKDTLTLGNRRNYFSLNGLPDTSKYYIDSVTVNGVRAQSSLTNINISQYIFQNTTINIVNKLKPQYIVNITSNYGGSISPKNTDTLFKYSSSTYSIFPNYENGYVLDSVFVNGIYLTNNMIVNGVYLNNRQNIIISSIISNVNIRVVFRALNKYFINVSWNNGGSVNSSGRDSLYFGQSRTYYFTPDNLYAVDSVFVNNQYLPNQTTNYSFNNVSSNNSLRVVFKFRSINTVSINYNTGGSVRNANYTLKNPGSLDTFLQGSFLIYYYITPNSGYLIDSFLVNDSLVTKTNANTYTYRTDTIKKNYNLRVVFRQQSWSVVNISYNTGGSVYFGSSLASYNNIIYNRQVFSGAQDSIREGDTAAYLFIPNNNFIVDSLFVDGVYQDTFSYDNQNNLRYIFRNLSGNHSIRVVFNVRAPYYRITRSNSPGGSIVLNNLALPPTGVDSFASGSTQRYSFVANQGYVVDSVFVNGTYYPDSVTGYTFRNISNNQNLRVVFKISSQPRILFIVITETDTTQRSYYIPNNSNYRVTYTPVAGQSLDSISLNNTIVSKDSTTGYTLYNVVSNQYLTLYYSPLKSKPRYQITTFAVNGQITPSFVADSGSTIRINYFSTPNFRLDSIIINGRVQGLDSTTGYTFYNIDSQINVRVVYKPNSTNITRYQITTFAVNGQISPSFVADSGSTIRINYFSTPNFRLDSIIINGRVQGLDSTTGYTFYNIDSQINVRIVYKPNSTNITRYQITTFAVNGQITPSFVADSGSKIRINYFSTPNFRLDSIIINGRSQSLDSVTGYTFYNIDSQINVRVVYKPITTNITRFQITTFAVNGQITPSFVADSGSTIRINYFSTPNFRLDSIIINGRSQSLDSVTGYTFYNINSQINVRVVYKPITTNITRFQITTSAVNGQITPSFVADSGSKIRINYYTTQIFRLDSIIINGIPRSLDSITGFTLIVTNPINIRVVFKQKPYYTITSTSNNGGFIISNNLIVGNGIIDSVLQGGSKFYTFQPTTGYIIDSLIVNDTVKNVSSSYVFSNVQSNQTLRVVFKLKPRKTYIITTSVSNGNITPSFILDSGRNAVILYQSLPNYVLNAIYVDGNMSTLDSANKFTFNNLNANHTIRVEYRLFVSPVIVKSVNIINNGNGNICRLNNIPNFPANCGTNFIDSLPIATPVNYFIQANYGYAIDSIRIFAISGSTLISRNFNDTFSLILNDIRSVNTIQVYFKRRPARLIYLAYGTNNNYNGDGGQIYSNNRLLNSKTVDTAIDGTSLLYFIQPATGYVIDSIFINNLLQPLNATIVITNVNSNNNIRIKFRSITTIVKTFNVRVINNTRQDTSTISIDSGGRLSLFFPDFANLVLDTIWINANGYRYFEILNADRTFTLSNIRFNVDVFVRYKPQIYTLNISGKIGNLIFNEARPLVANSNFRYMFPTILGYVIDSVFVNGNLSDSNLGFSFYNVLQNQTIRLVYDRPNIDDNYFNITTSIDNNGRISPNTTLPLGRSYTVYFAPQLGYEIDSVFVNNNYIDTAKSSYEIRNLNQNYQVRVKTKIRNVKITLNVAQGGGVYINNQWISNTQTILYIPYNTRIFGYVKADTLYRIDTVIANKFYFNYSLAGNFISKFFVPFEAVLLDSVYNITIRFVRIPVPNKPLIDTVIAGNSSAFVQFRANNSNSHFAIDYYIVKVFPSQTEIITKQSPAYIPNLINGNSYKFTVTAVNVAGKSVPSDSSKTIIPNPDYISISTQVIGGNGSVTASHRLRFGTDDTLFLKADTGYEIANVFINGTLINSLTGLQTTQYVLNNVSNNQNINVIYRPRKIYIYGSIGLGGSINVNSNYLFGNLFIALDYGSQAIFNITPNLGFGIDSIWVDGVYFPNFNLITNSSGNNYFIINTLKQSLKLKITFRKTKFQITTFTKGDGFISPNGSILLNIGSSQRIYFSAYYGAVIDSVFVNGILKTNYIKTNATNQGYYQFTNIQGDSSLRVVFKRQNYTIRVGSNNSNAGFISPAGFILVPVNGNQNINIFAKNNYRIDSVFVNNRKINFGTNQKYVSYYFNQVRGDSSIFVYFSKEYSTISSNTTIGGNIYPLGFVTTRIDDTINYYFIPEPGYLLSAIVVNGDTLASTSDSYQFTNVTTDQTIQAVFTQVPNGNGFSNGNISFAALPTYFISSSSNLNNLLSIAGKNIYDSGTTAIYTIYLPTNYQIDSVIIDGVNTTISGNIVRFSNLNANHTLRVVVSSLKYTISVVATDGGYLINPTTTLLNRGDNDTLNFVANTGYVIDSVIVDGVLLSPNSYSVSNNIGTYIFNNIDANHTIRVTFKASTYTITIQANQGGSADVNGNITLNLGESYTTNFSANAGYTIAKVKVDGAEVYNANGNYTFSNVDANHTIQIEFSFAQYSITQQNYLNNTLFETDTNVVSSGGLFTNTISNIPNYRLDRVLINGIEFNKANLSYNQGEYFYIFNNIRGDSNIKVFYIQDVTVQTIAVNGTITPSVTTPLGGHVTITYQGLTGYIISKIFIGGIDQGNDLSLGYGQNSGSYQFINLRQNDSIRVVFIPAPIPADFITISAISPNCYSENAVGSIVVKAQKAAVYRFNIKGTSSTNFSTFWFNDTVYSLNNLTVGNYDVCVTDTSKANLNRCFTVAVTAPQPISAFSIVDNAHKTIDVKVVQGQVSYINLNGNLYNSTNNLPLQAGVNTIVLKATPGCLDSFVERVVLTESLLLYPNPAADYVHVSVGGDDAVVDVAIYSDKGLLVLESKGLSLDNNGKLTLQISHLVKGVYLVKVSGNTTKASGKLIKN